MCFADLLCRVMCAERGKKSSSSLMTNDSVPAWIRQSSAWLAKHSQLYLMYEEYEKKRSQGHNVSFDDISGDSSEQDQVWGEYAEVASRASLELGERKRKAVVYDDGMTETQFLNMVEKEEKKKETARVCTFRLSSYLLLFSCVSPEGNQQVQKEVRRRQPGSCTEQGGGQDIE